MRWILKPLQSEGRYRCSPRTIFITFFPHKGPLPLTFCAPSEKCSEISKVHLFLLDRLFLDLHNILYCIYFYLSLTYGKFSGQVYGLFLELNFSMTDDRSSIISQIFVVQSVFEKSSCWDGICRVLYIPLDPAVILKKCWCCFQKKKPVLA